MTHAVRTCAIILLIALAVSAAVAEPVTLEYKFKKGGVDKYRLALDLSLDLSSIAAASGQNMPPMNFAMSVDLIQKTLDVYSDGSAKVKVTYTNPVIRGTGIPAAASKSAKAFQGQPVVMRISKRGKTMAIYGLDKMMSKAGVNLDFSEFMNASSGNVFLPEGPVEVGQSWTESIPIPFGTSQIYLQSTFAGYDEEIWNLRVARIHQSCSGRLDLKEMVQSFLNAMASQLKQSPPDLSSMSGQLTLNGEMTEYFAPSIGKLLKSGGVMSAQIDVTLPQGLTKQGAPASLSCGVNLQMAMTRFN